ncbi:MAG: ABC transporter substrate-binding protein [Nitrososphaera sp.]
MAKGTITKFGLLVALVSVVLGIGIVSITGAQNNKTTDVKQYRPVGQGDYVEYAKLFNVHYDGDRKVLTDGANRTLILQRSEETQPAADYSGHKIAAVPPAYAESDDNTILIPAKRIIVFSSTHAAMMDRLGIADRIVGVAWGGGYEWYIDSIKDGLETGRIRDVGQGNNPNYDEIVALKPDLVVLVGGTGMWEDKARKLDELGIRYVVNSEWLESDPVARFEWIKFFAALTDDEEKATSVFDEVKAKVDDITERVEGLDKPNVAWAGVFKGTAYVPRTESYVGKLIEMTGGKYLFEDLPGTGSAQISMEELVARGSNAEVLIYSSTNTNSTSEITRESPLLAGMAAIKSCSVYAFEPWYWQTLDQLDDTVSDVATIMHPEAFPDYQLKQFKKLQCDS